MTVGSAIFNRDTLALDDADLTQTFFEGINQRGWVPKTLMEKPYRREGLLRSRHERPRGHRATKQHAKIAAIQSCTMHIRFLLVDRRFIDHRIGSRAGAHGQNTPAFSIDHTASNPPSLGSAHGRISKKLFLQSEQETSSLENLGECLADPLAS
jgi:hypothetical protein